MPPNEITPAGPGYDDPVRAEGTAKLKAKMGGDTPWYKEKTPPAWVPMNQATDQANAVITSIKVPRRPAAQGETE